MHKLILLNKFCFSMIWSVTVSKMIIFTWKITTVVNRMKNKFYDLFYIILVMVDCIYNFNVCHFNSQVCHQSNQKFRSKVAKHTGKICNVLNCDKTLKSCTKRELRNWPVLNEFFLWLPTLEPDSETLTSDTRETIEQGD